MSTYAQVLLIAIPFFFGLIAIEYIYGWVKDRQTFRSFDTISSLSSGITNTIKNILGLSIVIVGYTWMHEHLAIMHIEDTIWVYIISFVLIDLAGYLQHLLSHKVNFFWNEHVVHHSSEEFNLACALRQPISNIFSIHGFMLIPAALLGLPPKVIATIAPIHLFLQFWYHTRHIGKLGYLEYLIITPSQHRVHHAINPEYIDKNIGQIFPWWDRLFGTFQEELDEVPCVYGIKKPAKTWNPILINFQHVWLLIKDAWRTKIWASKLLIWFMPTGWRPKDVNASYPIAIIDNPFDQNKYETVASNQLHLWSWFQLLVVHFGLIMVLVNFDDIGVYYLFVTGAWLMVHVYSYTTLMDLDKSAIIFEALKMLSGIWFTVLYAVSFEVSLYSNPWVVTCLCYLLLSFFMTYFFIKKEVINDQTIQPV